MDVYSDWVDACDAVAKDAADSTTKARPSNLRGTGAPTPVRRGGAATAEDDGFIEDDDLDAEAEYA